MLLVGVGVAVEGDVQPFFAAGFHQSENLVGTAWGAHALVEVGDVGGDSAAAADVDGFPQRV